MSSQRAKRFIENAALSSAELSTCTSLNLAPDLPVLPGHKRHQKKQKQKQKEKKKAQEKR